ncbi:MAG: AAA family ATPase [Actinobacteria bacterium]|nr:AAA family ATPase [Actinomycetota bacterium]
MLCPRCRSENEPGRKFCGECGSSLASPCPSCGSLNAPHLNFCGECGAGLQASTRSSETQRTGGWPGKQARKVVTLVFSDMAGSTALGEGRDPESIRGVLTTYFDEMRRVLEDHGGTIEKFIGDAVVAVFGIPQVHEDDALRAVRAAAEMQKAVAQLGEQSMTDWGVALEFRTGVNTGEVVSGELSREQGFATGDAVNVAARLEQHAPPGEVLIGENTYELVRDAVEAEPVEPLICKGKAEPVRAWKLRRLGGETGVARRLDSPLVGREEELARLHAELDLAGSSRSSRIATVLGEAGVGKSRLTNEFAASAVDRARILRGRCLSYGKGMTFWPVAEAVKQAAAIVETDTSEQARSKIDMLLPPDSEESRLIAEHVAGVIGLGQSSGGIQQSFWALRRLFEALAQSRPLILVFDDVHWAEPTFVDFLELPGSVQQGLPPVRLVHGSSRISRYSCALDDST